VLFLALLMWRVMEWAMQTQVDTTRTSLTGWDKQATERPTAFIIELFPNKFIVRCKALFGQK
jgi:hypothetical protein